MTAPLKILCCVSLLVGPITAAAKADEAPLQRTTAFEQAYGASFYQFDACGDEVAGRDFRKALVEKLKQCPFSEDAKQRAEVRFAAQRQISRRAMDKLIDDHGGLPSRLPGMTQNCREQLESPAYRQVRLRLDAYAAGRSGPDPVVPQPCDATEITP